MKIGIDGTEMFGERAIARYTYALITELARIDKTNKYAYFYLAYHKTYQKLIPRMSQSNVKNVVCKIPARILLSLWKNIDFPSIEYFTGEIDVFHSTNFTVPAQRKGKKIFTLHGIAYLEAPKLFPEPLMRINRKNLRIATEKCDYFVAVSHRTKEVFVNCTHTDPKSVSVIPLGLGEEFRALPDKKWVRQEILRRFQLSANYILYVGAMEKWKNIEGILEAFRRLAQKRTDHHLVLVGGKGQIFGDLLKRETLYGLTKKVIWIEHLPQKTDDLPILYNGASCFLFPSFVEGWASPPLEAMKCGCPVVTSNVSSLPETVGDAALKVNPHDPEEIADAVEKVLSDSELRADLIAKGLKRASQFTWERMAKAHLEVYKKVTEL